MRLDLHIHTSYSFDCWMSLERVIEAAQGKVDGLAVIDHDEIEGEMAPFLVIVGEEIVTREGEIAGLFLEERIPPGYLWRRR